MDAKLHIKDLTIGYISKRETKVVYDGLSANFESGMMVGIVGKNGLGKSTLLRTIAGLQDKLKGDIAYNGNALENIPKSELAKILALVLTEKVGGFNLTVTDMVSLGRIPYTNAFNQLSSVDEKVVEECISVCGLTDHSSKPVIELSDGLFQKAMIAKALAQQTSFLLLDEPTAYLDFPSKHQLFEILKKVSVEDKKCIITSSHDIELVLKYCSHLLIMAEDSEYELIETSNYRTSVLFTKVTNGYFV